MNYLAHLFLAGNNDNLVIGNFIADHVKGNGIDQFSIDIRQGIKMHRDIDQYTDAHPIVRQSINRLRPTYRKYAGVIVDMFYDHYLATSWGLYADQSLYSFTQSRYELLFRNFEILPARSQRILSHMAHHNWLMSYAELNGLQQALTGMSHRTTFISRMEHAVNDLKECYECYSEEFRLYFPNLCSFVQKEYGSLLQE